MSRRFQWRGRDPISARIVREREAEQQAIDAQAAAMEAEGAPALAEPEPPPPAPPKPFSMHCYLCNQVHADEKQWSEHLGQWSAATRKKVVR